MEFPDIGERCSWPPCQTLDFLPFTCAYCNQVFCKDHFNQFKHECEAFKKNIGQVVSVKSFVCTTEGCNTYSPVEMLCPKCENHFCLLHRYHNCFDTILDLEEKKKLWNAPIEQFAQAVKNVHNIISDNIKKQIQNPKKQATAMKVQLMRLKGKATGPPNIPQIDKIYFLIGLPKSSKKVAKAVYVNKDWSVGKVIDSVSTTCNVVNKNNEMMSPKLRLFKESDGKQISLDTSFKISELISTNKIVNGETLILEYVSPNEDLTNYILPDFNTYDISF